MADVLTNLLWVALVVAAYNLGWARGMLRREMVQ